MPVHSHNDPVARGERLAHDLPPIVVEGSPRLAELLHHRVAPDKRPGLRPVRPHLHDRVGVIEPSHALHVPGVPDLVVVAHDLDVLLRHGLLRHPGGFEGLGLTRVAAPPDDPPTTYLAELPDRLSDGHVAPLPAPADMRGDNMRSPTLRTSSISALKSGNTSKSSSQYFRTPS